jgi:hypothetical protein
MQEQTQERPAPDYRDYLEIGIGGDDDDSSRHTPKDPDHESEQRVLH